MMRDRRHATAVNGRGFAMYGTFPDGFGHTVRVVESSSAAHNAAWIFCQSAEGQDFPPHVTRASATALIEALHRFLADEAEAEPPAYGREEGSA